MKHIIFLLCLFPCFSSGETLRLSHVVSKAGEGITKFEFGSDEARQTIFVEDKAIVTEKDVQMALPSLSNTDAIDITLSVDGAAKMTDATAKMQPGVDRIAILIKGKVKSAPVVQSVPLGRNFVISGLDAPEEPETLAALISGKTLDQIQKEKEEKLKSLPPRREPEYHTDEEYAALKQTREKVGLNYMDRIYTETEIDTLLSTGMTREEVEAIFGKPHRVRTKDASSRLEFETAPERYPMNTEQRMVGFTTLFKGGKLASWESRTWNGSPRETKPNSSNAASNLIVETPDADMSSEDFDFITFVEGQKITLKPGEITPTENDYFSLLSTLWSISSNSAEDKSIDPKCDMVTIVAAKLPAVELLAKKSPEDGIPLPALEAVIKPYIFGEKPLP